MPAASIGSELPMEVQDKYREALRREGTEQPLDRHRLALPGDAKDEEVRAPGHTDPPSQWLTAADDRAELHRDAPVLIRLRPVCSNSLLVSSLSWDRRCGPAYGPMVTGRGLFATFVRRRAVRGSH